MEINSNTYTWADLFVIQQIIMDKFEPSKEMLEHYDLDGDGKVTAMDYVDLKNKLIDQQKENE